MRSAWSHLVVLTLVSLLAGSRTAGAQNPEEQLAAAKSLECKFAVIVTGTWGKDGAPAVDTKTSTFTIVFREIDSDEGSAQAIGAFGPSDITVKMSAGTLHFLQSFRDGPLYATSVFSSETKPGFLKAVHSRHEYTPVSVPGFTSRPEQYYGECAAK